MSKLPALLLALTLTLFRPELAFAQTGPLEGPSVGTSTITATVPDNLPPTAPVLISPDNNSTITTGYATFVWEKSYDENGILKYELWLDGTEYLKNLPPHDAETSEYLLDYENTTGEFTLTLKNALADGTHTWKVTVFDTLNNGASSATWSFTIDSQAPSFVLTQVGELSTSISAQDINTLPSEPLKLTQNQPQLYAQGEANSTVELVVIIPGDPTQTFTNTIDINGNWGQLLGILPRDVIMELNFTITDQAGLVSVLNGVPFMIVSRVITFPPTPSTPSPAIIEPGATPLPMPPTLPKPLFSFKIIPPIEIAHQIIQESWEHLPQPLKAAVSSLPIDTQQRLVVTAVSLQNYLLLILLGMALIWLLLTLLRRYGTNLSLRLVFRALQALYFAPRRHPQGLVFRPDEATPLKFVDVLLLDDDEAVKDVAITDKHGVYGNLKLKPGKYRLSISQDEYNFPTSHARPNHLTMAEFYLGEEFEQTQQDPDYPQLFHIPADQIKEPKTGLLTLHQYAWLSSTLTIPWFIIAGLITILYPSLWNQLVMGLYTLRLIFALFSHETDLLQE